MNLEHKIKISLLKKYATNFEALQDIWGVSKSQLKKYEIPKKWLSQTTKERTAIEVPIDLANYLKINPLYSGAKVNILAEDENFIALSKPSFVHCHPLQYTDTNNLLSSFYGREIECFLQVNNQQYDRGLLYRLDYETSGLILYAKSDEIYQSVRSHFNEIMLSKFYYAIVTSGFKKKELIHRLGPSQKKGSKMKESESGDFAQLEIEKLKENEHYSLLKIKLHQGLRHQIRVQLALSGFPIVGDTLYGGETSDRLRLHCYEYQLNLNDREVRFRDENIKSLEDGLFNSNK